jgi:nucleoid DNA-binding protein
MTTSKINKTTTKAATSNATEVKSSEQTFAQKNAVKAAVKDVVEAPKATPVVVDSPQPVVSGPVMRKKELIDLVVERSGIKKKDAKPVVEATLEILGEALAETRELNLQPLGKVKVRREKLMPNGRVMVTKIRQSMPNTNTSDDTGSNDVSEAAE